MADRKYEFVPFDEITIGPGRTVKRIRALIAIGALADPGDVGGYVESDANLDAQVSGNAWVSGDARDLLTIGPIGSRAATLTIHADSKIGVRYSTGCFSGTRWEFEVRIADTHGDSAHGSAYRAAIALGTLLVDPHEDKRAEVAQ